MTEGIVSKWIPRNQMVFLACIIGISIVGLVVSTLRCRDITLYNQLITTKVGFKQSECHA
jgi:hypothetical protein